jgi:NADP-dependent 3-hydroxy acid dehydrogenase YdfG
MADAEPSRFPIHPTLVDACFQLLALAKPTGKNERDDDAAAYVPFAAERVVLHSADRDGLRGVARARLGGVPGAAEAFSIDAFVVDAHDRLILSVTGLSAKRAPEGRVLDSAGESLSRSVFDLKWRDVVVAARDRTARRVLIVGRPCALRESCRRALVGSGDRVESVDSAAGALSILSADPAMTHLLVVHDPRDAYGLEPIGQALGMMIDVVRGCAKRGTPLAVVLVTRGAMAWQTKAGPSPESAALWGMARSIAGEMPHLGWTRVDLDPEVDDEQGAVDLGGAIDASTEEPEVCCRAGRIYAPRIVRSKWPDSLRTDSLMGTTILTGAFGGLGRAVARRLVEQRVESVVLLGRNVDRAFVRDLEASDAGRTVRICPLAVDVADRTALDEVLKQVRRELPAVTAIVHAAGVIEDALASDLTPESIARVLAPKTEGAWNLHELTLGDPLKAFVFFGSASALFSVPGQGAYAAGNAYMTALAEARRAQSRPASCIQWGPWAAGAAVGLERRWARLGVAPLSVAAGVDLTMSAIGMGNEWPVAALVLRPAGESSRWGTADIALLRELSGPSAPRLRAEESAFRNELLALPAVRRHRALVRYLQQVVGRMMGVPDSEPPDPKVGVTELGLDSLMAVDLRDRLQGVVGRALPAAVVLEHSTLDLLARFLLSELQTDLPAPATAPSAAAPPSTPLPPANDLAALSDDALTRLLARELDGESASTFGDGTTP